MLIPVIYRRKIFDAVKEGNVSEMSELNEMNKETETGESPENHSLNEEEYHACHYVTFMTKIS